MRGDLHQAAFRLMQQLPVRTHVAPEPVPVPGRARSVHREGSGGHNRRAIKIDGREFKSVSAAKRGMKVATRTIQAWLQSGRAQRI